MLSEVAKEEEALTSTITLYGSKRSVAGNAQYEKNVTSWFTCRIFNAN